MSATIVAPATAVARAGVAILRISGPDAAKILKQVFSRASRAVSHSHLMVYGNALNQGRVIDEAMAVFMKAPNSYTREDVAEIHLHGGPAVVGQALDACLTAGAAIAQPGEFTRRAFENGRIDLSRAEAVMDLIGAQSESAARQALEQLSGGVFQRISALRQKLVDLLAEMEAYLDYPEEDIGALRDPEGRVHSLLREIGFLIDSYRAGRLRREGLKVVLLGAPNAGKSALFNALLDRPRAIVTPVAGTTRDLIEDTLYLDGILIRLIDTAGLRRDADPVEAIGIERATEAAEQADLIIRVIDGSDQNPAPVPGDRPIITVYQKSDLPDFYAPKGAITVSAQTGEGLDLLREELARFIAGQAAEGACISSLRHRDCLERAREALNQTQSACLDGVPLDCQAVTLREALSALGEITGDEATEDVIDAVFSKFCLGK